MKQRKKIPPKVESKILVANRHACCLCQRTDVQIHHIDENPANNDLSNLAVLCINHHDLATRKGGITRKLKPKEIKEHKKSWEKKCEEDILALARDRLTFYATAYKNPQRIREMFIQIPKRKLQKAVDILKDQIIEEQDRKTADKGFDWQAVPKTDNNTLRCLISIRDGELWPSWLPRVKGHPLDPEYPIDLSPPDGMRAFHLFDLYCQLIVRVITIINPTLLLEQIIKLKTPSLIDSLSGNLVVFRRKAYGKNIEFPRDYERQPVGLVQLRSKLNKINYCIDMTIKNMYIFSDTSVGYLENQKICGVGILGGAKDGPKPKKVTIQVTPLLIGIGGYTGPNPDGYWNSK
jgi:hypothetical protein